MEQQIIFGSSVLENCISSVVNPVITMPGYTLKEKERKMLGLDEALLSRHILLLGGSGSGKTNTIKFMIRALRDNMTNDDIMVIFDTKGEFYSLFSKEDDYLIGNSSEFQDISYTWNIFDEILIDGYYEPIIQMNAREIASALFHGRGSETQPFFCNAARDIFRGVLLHFIRRAKKNPMQYMELLNNKALVDFFSRKQIEDYIEIFKSYPDLTGLLTYFGDGKTNQGLGVFGELNSMLSDYFVGILADYRKDKNISMRRAVRQKKGKSIFIEYDLALGETLTPIYRLLIDQVLKEGLSRKNKGHIYLIADEFKLLPKLQHIDDALNFGRSQGIRVIAGIQSINQLYDIYGQEKGSVLASGFGSFFAFYTNDATSREYVTRRFGKNIISYVYENVKKNEMLVHERDGNTIEEWDQIRLGIGQAFIGLGYKVPFFFDFDEYDAFYKTENVVNNSAARFLNEKESVYR